MCQIVLRQGQRCRVGSSVCADMIKDTLVGILKGVRVLEREKMVWSHCCVAMKSAINVSRWGK